MNRIQLISQDIQARRLKLQMGLDPSADIEPRKVHEMWRQLVLDRIEAKLNSQSIGAGYSKE